MQALFDQHSSTWVIQAKRMDRDILGWEMPPSLVSSLACSYDFSLDICTLPFYSISRHRVTGLLQDCLLRVMQCSNRQGFFRLKGKKAGKV